MFGVRTLGGNCGFGRVILRWEFEGFWVHIKGSLSENDL